MNKRLEDLLVAFDDDPADPERRGVRWRVRIEVERPMPVELGDILGTSLPESDVVVEWLEPRIESGGLGNGDAQRLVAALPSRAMIELSVIARSRREAIEMGVDDLRHVYQPLLYREIAWVDA